MKTAGPEGVHGGGRAEQMLTREPRLARAAHEFEAQMMKELLAPMTGKDPLFGGNDGEDAGILGQFASESLAGALSAGGGLGLAGRIMNALSRADHATANRQGMGPEIKTQ